MTLVLQVGLPASGEQYIHRLGRTARAGAAGRGILVLSLEEKMFLRKADVAALGIREVPAPPSTTSSPSLPEALSKVSQDTKDRKSTRLNSSHSGESRMPSSA